jgi:hypothetical protein
MDLARPIEDHGSGDQPRSEAGSALANSRRGAVLPLFKFRSTECLLSDRVKIQPEFPIRKMPKGSG